MYITKATVTIYTTKPIINRGLIGSQDNHIVIIDDHEESKKHESIDIYGENETKLQRIK